MKALKYTVLALVGAFVLFMAIGLLFGDRVSPAADAAPSGTDTSSESTPASIPGMNPADVYLSLEDRGYTTSKEFNTQRVIWVCSSSDAAMSFVVTMSGKTATTVDLIKAIVLSMDGGSIAPAQHVLAFVASAPYTGAEPQRAKDWVLEHYDQDGATITIGPVKLTIQAPTVQSRILVMEPA